MPLSTWRMKAKRPSFISVFTSCLWAGKSSLACYLCAVWALLNICKGWVRAASNTVKKFTICARYRRWCSGCSGKGYATTARLGLNGFCGKWGLTFVLAVFAVQLRFFVCPYGNGQLHAWPQTFHFIHRAQLHFPSLCALVATFVVIGV